MQIDTSKLTKKDVGEYIIQTDISLEENGFATEQQSFKLSITAAADAVTEAVSEEIPIKTLDVNDDSAPDTEVPVVDQEKLPEEEKAVVK